MKFDLEKAKAGEPLEVRFTKDWEPCSFVGMRKRGQTVVELHGGALIATTDEDLRMAAENKPLRYRLARLKALRSGLEWVVAVNTDGSEKETQRNEMFVEWLDEWQEIEVNL